MERGRAEGTHPRLRVGNHVNYIPARAPYPRGNVSPGPPRNDIVLLDISMTNTAGFGLIPALKDKLPRVKIILVIMLSDPFYIREGFRTGADGYVLKQAASPELMAAILAIMNYRRYVSADVVSDVRESIEHPWARPEGYTVKLTVRQQEVLVMIANGVPVKTIAIAMGICKKTVEFHKAGIHKNLG